MNKLTGTLVYVCVPNPVDAYKDPSKPDKPKEWKASVVLTDEDEVDAYQEFVEKKCKSKASIKKVKSDKFEETYNCSLPDGAGKNVWVITVRKSTELGSTGKPVPEQYRPRVYLQEGRNRNEITNEKLVGNGSKGSVSLELFEKRDGSATIYLKNILVTDLIEFVKTESVSKYNPGSEFDEDADNESDTDSADDTPAPAPKVAEKKPTEKSKPASKKAASADTDAENDVPW